MRPVDRGDAPTDSDGNPITFPNYDKAKYYLFGRLGKFCSYCERRLATHINVEHVTAQHAGGAVIDWDNFLLACQNCNSTKGAKPIHGLYFPHETNTAFAFEYQEGAVIVPNPNLPSSVEIGISQKTLELFGLDRLTPSKPGDYDTRFDDYIERWGSAQRSRERWNRNPTVELKEQIAETVSDNGAFSIYMTIFSDIQEVREEILVHFDKWNVRRSCFDPATTAVIPDLNL